MEDSGVSLLTSRDALDLLERGDYRPVTVSRDLSPQGIPPHHSTLVDSSGSFLSAGRTGNGLNPPSCPPLVSSDCISCPGRWTWICNHGYSTNDQSRDPNPSSDELRVQGGWCMSYRGVDTSRHGTRRSRRARCRGYFNNVISVGNLALLVGMWIHMVSLFMGAHPGLG